jgi:hypothetical protein
VTTVAGSRSWSEARRTVVGTEKRMKYVPLRRDAWNALSARDVRSAEPVVVRASSSEEWAPHMWSRVVELSTLPRGWDSYGALPLQQAAIEALRDTIAELSDSINSAPALSLTTDGGLHCEWIGAEHSVTLTIDGSGAVSVLHEHAPSGVEWEGPLDEALDLEKKVWHSSLQ